MPRRAGVAAALLAAVALVLGAVRAAAAISASGESFDATAGHQFAGRVATFSDTTPSQQSATIDWGDGSQAAQGTIACTNCPSNSPQLAVSGSHTYAQVGTFTVTVHISDVDQDSATATGSAHVGTPPAAQFTVMP